MARRSGRVGLSRSPAKGVGALFVSRGFKSHLLRHFEKGINMTDEQKLIKSAKVFRSITQVFLSMWVILVILFSPLIGLEVLMQIFPGIVVMNLFFTCGVVGMFWAITGYGWLIFHLDSLKMIRDNYKTYRKQVENGLLFGINFFVGGLVASILAEIYITGIITWMIVFQPFFWGVTAFGLILMYESWRRKSDITNKEE